MKAEVSIRRPGLPMEKMVHDLFQSLRTISLNAQRLQRLSEWSGAERPLAEIVGAARLQEELLRSISEYDHAAQVGLTGNSRIPLDAAIQSACLRVELFRQSQAAEIQVDGLVPFEVPSGMAKVFEKVLHNALKFRRLGITPVVRVDAKVDEGGALVVAIADNGIGVERDRRARIFEPFMRLNPASAYPGCALGLATCRLLVESVGGSIGLADTESGQGLLVEISLPIPVTPARAD